MFLAEGHRILTTAAHTRYAICNAHLHGPSMTKRNGLCMRRPSKNQCGRLHTHSPPPFRQRATWGLKKLVAEGSSGEQQTTFMLKFRQRPQQANCGSGTCVGGCGQGPLQKSRTCATPCNVASCMGRWAGTNPRFPIPRHIPQVRHPWVGLVHGFRQCNPPEGCRPLCCGNLCTLHKSRFSRFL